ncbi:hypothetical protein [Parasphingorhabdus sp.]|uniref:hypothetical protein n=1 Tax=Parasphingorhabdus sp. TaxID=2709688 RepID=UPI003A90DA6A
MHQKEIAVYTAYLPQLRNCPQADNRVLVPHHGSGMWPERKLSVAAISASLIPSNCNDYAAFPVPLISSAPIAILILKGVRPGHADKSSSFI